MPSLCKQGVRGSSPLGSTCFPLSEGSYSLLVADGHEEVQQQVQQRGSPGVWSPGVQLVPAEHLSVGISGESRWRRSARHAVADS
jgi:hypothetical protein